MQRAIAIMFAAMSLIPLGNAAGKTMADANSVSPVFVSWTRFTVGALCFLPLIYIDKQTFSLLPDRQILVRALIPVIGIKSILQALSSVPITTVYCIFFVGPLISYILAMIFLN